MRLRKVQRFLQALQGPSGSDKFLPNHHADLAGRHGRIYRFESAQTLSRSHVVGGCQLRCHRAAV